MISISLRGVTNALARAGKLERAERELKREIGEGMVERIRENIRSRSGRLSASWRSAVSRPGQVSIRSTGVVYARASVGGAFITPKRRRALRLHNGRFARFVRLNPGAYIGRPGDRKTSYVTLAFQRFGDVCREAFGKSFGGRG